MKSDMYKFIEMMGDTHKLSIVADDDTFYIDIKTVKDWYVVEETSTVTFAFKKDGNFQRLIGGE